jgi:hypothetical protein
VSAVLLTRLKITDLTALTALEAGRRMLPPDVSLDRVVREEVFLFEAAPDAGPAGFERKLHEAIETSNFFVNPNKERFRFLGAAERGERWSAPEGAWGILTRTSDDTRDEGLRARLEREHPLPGLGAIRRARVWWLWTQEAGGGNAGAAARDAAYERLGPLRGPTRGLLVNPHAEASLPIFGEVAWRDVDRFLSEPAPEPALS